MNYNFTLLRPETGSAISNVHWCPDTWTLPELSQWGSFRYGDLIDDGWILEVEVAEDARFY